MAKKEPAQQFPFAILGVYDGTIQVSEIILASSAKSAETEATLLTVAKVDGKPNPDLIEIHVRPF